MSIPIVCVIGSSGSGKTWLIERLVPELATRGIHAAYVKHTHHDVPLEAPGKDTHRVASAGAATAALATPSGITMAGDWARGDQLEEIAFVLAGRYDIVLAEGFSSSKHFKIGVAGTDMDRVLGAEALVAVVGDAPVPGGVTGIAADDVSGVADFIEERFLNDEDGGPSVDILVDGARVPLNPFLRTVLARVVTGVVGALKDVPAEPGDVRVRIGGPR